jgi:tripartite-type tricarboxylate transporter receptor subunit TctC
MQKAGFETVAVTPERFSDFIRQDIARWGKVIREANLSVD